jgi:hypothetical protein
MRLNWTCGIGVLTLLMGMAIGSTSSAQSAVPSSGTTKSEKSELVQELRSAHKLLAVADHDYDGHRARAAAEVHKAIKDLLGTHHPKKAKSGSATTPPVNPPAKQPAVHEPQATSDAQLRQAQTILQGVLAELNAHHPKAAANIDAAIVEINTALKIK